MSKVLIVLVRMELSPLQSCIRLEVRSKSLLEIKCAVFFPKKRRNDPKTINFGSFLVLCKKSKCLE